MSNRNLIIIDGQTGEVEGGTPAKDKRYRCKLDTALDVQRELSKLYREARSGVVEPAVATKLGWLLGEVRKAIETSTLEKRLELLEQEDGKFNH